MSHSGFFSKILVFCPFDHSHLSFPYHSQEIDRLVEREILRAELRRERSAASRTIRVEH